MPKTSKPTDKEKVAAYMQQLQHPLIPEIEMLRDIIRSSDAAIGERIKWNAPSYYYAGEDMVTFNLRDTSQVHLIFHHPTIESISSKILAGWHVLAKQPRVKDRVLFYSPPQKDRLCNRNK